VNNLLAKPGYEDEGDPLFQGDQFLSCRDSIHPGHENVAHNDVRCKAGSRLDKFFPVAHSSDNMKGLAEESHDGAPHFVVVLSDQHTLAFHDEIAFLLGLLG
jgi:hypothetical protein